MKASVMPDGRLSLPAELRKKQGRWPAIAATAHVTVDLIR